MAKRDYYEVLGVSKSASPDEIKKAFRRAAIEHHPDKGGDAEKFKEINEAYEVLKDTDKRQRYDQFGHAGVGNGGTSGFEGFGGFGGFGGGQQFEVDLGDMGLGDIFSSFFGGGFNRAGGSRQARARDIETNVTLDFEEAIFGTERTLRLNLQQACTRCQGTRNEPGSELKRCQTCEGKGQVVRTQRTILGTIQQATICSTCQGEGVIPEKLCTQCHGKGVEQVMREVKVKIPAGIDEGSTIRLRSQGEQTAKGAVGDLYVNVRVKPHKRFTREGNLILSEQHVPMVDAALGAQLKVDTVDGAVTMKIPPGTQSGTDFRLRGHGVPKIRDGARGDHIVRINVETPTKLNKEQQELLQKFAESTPKRFWHR